MAERARLSVARSPGLPSWPQRDELRHGLRDRAVSRHPPPNGSWIHLQAAGRLHLGHAHPLEMTFELWGRHCLRT